MFCENQQKATTYLLTHTYTHGDNVTYIHVYIYCFIFCRTDFKVVSLKFKKDDAKKKTTAKRPLSGSNCCALRPFLHVFVFRRCLSVCVWVWEIMHVNVGSKPRLTVIAKNVR